MHIQMAIHKKKQERSRDINFDNFNITEIKDEYQREVHKRISEKTITANNQEKWDNIKTTKEILGTKTKTKCHNDPEIIEVSKKQKNI